MTASVTDSAGADAVSIDHRPTAIASATSVVVAAVAVALVVNSPAAVTAIATVGVGSLLLAALSTVPGRGVVDWLVTAIGVVVVAAGLGVAATASLDGVTAVVLYPGLLGVAVYGLALRPVRRGWETALATAAGANVLLCVLVAGLVQNTGRLPLLAATVGVVVSWDAARQAITLGQQVGRRADTAAVEVVHVGVTALVGVVVVAVAEVVWSVGVTGVPLSGLLVLLGAAIAFVMALYA